MYFKQFPSIFYNFEIDGEVKLIVVKDIALNVRVRKEIFDRITLYDEYDIEDGETFDLISEKLYGSPYYHWTIMLMNLRFDYRKDFPMTDVQLQKYVEQKYGVDNVYAPHEIVPGVLHFEDKSGHIVTKLQEQQWNVIHPYGSFAAYQSQLISNIAPLLTETEFLIAYPGQTGYAQYVTARNYEIQRRLNAGMNKYEFKLVHPHSTYEIYSRGFISISNREYEYALNEQKRRIKVLNPSIIDKVARDVRELIQNG